MKKYNINIKNIEIKPHNILFAWTSMRDLCDMDRIMLLEGMPETEKEEFVLAEGGHCSCYDFDETNWDCVVLNEAELKKILENANWGLRKYLKDFFDNYTKRDFR